MASELSLNQTVQAEVGEFNNLYVNGVEVTTGEDNDFTGDVEFLEDVLVKGELSNLGTMLALDFELVSRFDEVTDPDTGEVTYTPVKFFPAKTLSNLYDLVETNTTDISTNATDITTNALAIQSNAGNITTNASNISSNTSRISALEAASFDSSIVDNLSTSVQALQTRTGTLESLIGLLTNNNTNDTDIEHRITRIEKTILALKAIHDAKKSVYNIPLDW